MTSSLPEQDDEEPVLPDVTTDERHTGWGEDTDGDVAGDDERLTRERPPHW